MPVFNQIYEDEYRAAGVQVLGVSQYNTSHDETVAFIDEKGLAFPNTFDEGAELAAVYGVTGVPTYVFLDRDGVVQDVSPGAQGMEPLTEIMDRLLSE